MNAAQTAQRHVTSKAMAKQSIFQRNEKYTVPFILSAALALAYIKAPSAENVITRAFEGTERRMVILAALLGDLSPFCSYEVIPFIATLLAFGTPLSAVMAFWLTSPLMDQAMFLITSGT